MKSVLRVLGLWILLPVASCFAATITYTATLLGSNEAPTPTPSTATGFITVTLNGDLLTVSENWTGLTGAATGAHIHCCAGPAGTAPVEVPFSAFPATASGTYTNTFNLSTLSYTAGFTEATLIAGLSSGLAYANIHTAAYPGGEIRGQLAVVTPEPGSLWLLGTGLLGGVGMWRRRLLA